MAEVELFGYRAVLNRRRDDAPYIIGSLEYPGGLVSCGNPHDITRYQMFLEAVKIKMQELNQS